MNFSLCLLMADIWLVSAMKPDYPGQEIALSTAESDVKRTNFQGKTLRIASVTSFPFQNVSKGPSGAYAGDGFSFAILDQMATYFNFSYEIVVPPDDEYGKLVNKSYWTGLIGLVVNKSADMAAATISKTPERRLAVTFSGHLYKDSLGMLVKRPKGNDNTGALLAPFSTQVWILVIVASTVMGPTLYVFILVHRNLVPRKRRGRKSKKRESQCCALIHSNGAGLGDCVWFVYSSLLKQSSSLCSPYSSVRILMAFWWMTSMLITAFYSANLTAFLTLQTANLGNDLESLLNAGFKWMYLEGTALDDVLMQDDHSNMTNQNDREQFTLLKKSLLQGMGIPADNAGETFGLIQKGYAYLEETYLLNHLLRQDFAETGGECRFTVRDLKFFYTNVGFAFPKDSPYADEFSNYIEVLQQNGFILKWMHQYMPKMEVCAVDKENKISENEQPLTLGEVYSAFYLLIFGATGGTVVLILENLSRKCKRKRKKDSFESNTDNKQKN